MKSARWLSWNSPGARPFSEPTLPVPNKIGELTRNGTHADINGGVVELVDRLRAKGIRQALVTNSHREAMEIVLERYHLHFEVALCRNDGKIKPSSDLIEQALKVLGLPPEEVVGIGDGRYDIEACRRVGIPCIYLTHGTPTLEHTPSVASLHEVLPLLSVLDRASETG